MLFQPGEQFPGRPLRTPISHYIVWSQPNQFLKCASEGAWFGVALVPPLLLWQSHSHFPAYTPRQAWSVENWLGFWLGHRGCAKPKPFQGSAQRLRSRSLIIVGEVARLL